MTFIFCLCYDKKYAKKFALHKKAVSLHRFRANVLGYGVMVTLQILVLPFLVRVRVAQQRKRDANASLFLSFFIFHSVVVEVKEAVGCGE